MRLFTRIGTGLILIAVTNCGKSSFQGQSNSSTAVKKPSNSIVIKSSTSGGIEVGKFENAAVTMVGAQKVKACSEFLDVPATSNPWLAKAPAGTVLKYPGQTAEYDDKAPEQSPILHSSNCIASGKVLVFETDSTAAHTPAGGKAQKGEGNLNDIQTFLSGPIRSLSSLTAPIDSLIAVFLPASFDESQPSPETLDFKPLQAREFNDLKPKLRQMFYIGSGRKTDGTVQTFTVPDGAAEIVFGSMDLKQWNNNVGSHKVRVNEAVP